MTCRPLSRRSFLATTAAFGAWAATGCANSLSDGTPSNNDTLRILNWADYIDEETVARFSGESRYDVRYDASYEDNEAAWNDLFLPAIDNGRPVGYDIVVPTYWLAARLAERDFLEPLPRELIPNHVNIDPGFLTPSWDRGARLQMPWQAGITGIAYNPALTNGAVGSIADLFDPAYRGRVGLVAEMRETVPLVMLLQGNDPSRPTFDTAMAAIDQIESAVASGQIARFTFGEFKDALDSGEFALSLAWSGDIVQLQADRPDIEFVVPEEGGIRWFDTMVVPRGAANVEGAARWMNFVYDPTNAALITTWVQYVSPVLGVRDALANLGGESAALADNEILFPTDAIKRRLYTWGGLRADEEEQLESRFTTLAG